jgi:hypothetical protein
MSAFWQQTSTNGVPPAYTRYFIVTPRQVSQGCALFLLKLTPTFLPILLDGTGANAQPLKQANSPHQYARTSPSRNRSRMSHRWASATSSGCATVLVSVLLLNSANMPCSFFLGRVGGGTACGADRMWPWRGDELGVDGPRRRRS